MPKASKGERGKLFAFLSNSLVFLISSHSTSLKFYSIKSTTSIVLTNYEEVKAMPLDLWTTWFLFSFSIISRSFLHETITVYTNVIWFPGVRFFYVGTHAPDTHNHRVAKVKPLSFNNNRSFSPPKKKKGSLSLSPGAAVLSTGFRTSRRNCYTIS